MTFGALIVIGLTQFLLAWVAFTWGYDQGWKDGWKGYQDFDKWWEERSKR